MTQQLPTWVEVETAKGRRSRAVKPTPKDMPKRKPAESEIPADVQRAIDRAMTAGNYEKARVLRAPYITPPGAEPKPEIPPIPRLHVRVELTGSIEFVLEGDEADGLRDLLANDATADDVIEHLDPWSSGAAVRQRVTILQDPAGKGDFTFWSWYVNEAAGEIEQRLQPEWGGVFYYAAGDSAKPKLVDWNHSPYPVRVDWEPK